MTETFIEPLTAEDHARLLHKWADVLDIPSGQFVNDDLKNAADAFDGLLAEIARLKNNRYQEGFTNGSRRAKEKAQGEIDRLRAELNEWHSCARYDPLMNGAQFKGWDRSQMDRCRKRFIEGAREALGE